MDAVSTDEQVSQVSYWEAQTAIGKQTLQDALQVYQERQNSLEGVANRINIQMEEAGKVKAALVALDYRVEEMRSSEGGIGDEIQKFNELIEPAEKELAELEADPEQELGQESTVRQNTSLGQNAITTRRRSPWPAGRKPWIPSASGSRPILVWSSLNTPTRFPARRRCLWAMTVEHLPMVEEISDDLDEILKQQRMQLSRLGAVNPDAQKEYREVSERHEFLTDQVKDLRHAEADIKEVIAELDELMERDFRKTFEVVAREFKQMFTRLFAGGAAKLVLTEGRRHR